MCLACAHRRPLPPWEFKDYLGWMEQGDGRLAYGVFVANGRLSGDLKQARTAAQIRVQCPSANFACSCMLHYRPWNRVPDGTECDGSHCACSAIAWVLLMQLCWHIWSRRCGRSSSAT